jgi:hypothetical protein
VLGQQQPEPDEDGATLSGDTSILDGSMPVIVEEPLDDDDGIISPLLTDEAADHDVEAAAVCNVFELPPPRSCCCVCCDSAHSHGAGQARSFEAEGPYPGGGVRDSSTRRSTTIDIHVRGGDNGSTKMWNRREISASSDDDLSHYLHPHP